MRGAIAGDIIGSVYENRKQWTERRTPDFEPLFAPKARFTDDTVLTVAVADYLLHGGDLVQYFKTYYANFPNAGYGKWFKAWAASDDEGPYGSWGNGAAMRVSPVGWAFSSFEEVIYQAKQTAQVTHNHPEAIKGAQATAAAIYLARTRTPWKDMQEFIEQRFGYDLSGRVDDIRLTYKFDWSSQGSVPQAIIAFLDSEDYETAVRLAVSLGGDTDTLACIAGVIAQAFYAGVPEKIREETWKRLPEAFRDVVAEFEQQFMAVR